MVACPFNRQFRIHRFEDDVINRLSGTHRRIEGTGYQVHLRQRAHRHRTGKSIRLTFRILLIGGGYNVIYIRLFGGDIVSQLRDDNQLAALNIGDTVRFITVLPIQFHIRIVVGEFHRRDLRTRAGRRIGNRIASKFQDNRMLHRQDVGSFRGHKVCHAGHILSSARKGVDTNCLRISSSRIGSTVRTLNSLPIMIPLIGDITTSAGGIAARHLREHTALTNRIHTGCDFSCIEFWTNSNRDRINVRC